MMRIPDLIKLFHRKLSALRVIAAARDCVHIGEASGEMHIPSHDAVWNLKYALDDLDSKRKPKRATPPV